MGNIVNMRVRMGYIPFKINRQKNFGIRQRNPKRREITSLERKHLCLLLTFPVYLSLTNDGLSQLDEKEVQIDKIICNSLATLPAFVGDHEAQLYIFSLPPLHRILPPQNEVSSL